MTNIDGHITDGRPWHLWVVGLLALLWNGFGALDFVGSTFAPDVWLGDMIGYTESQIAYIKSFEWWQSALWFIGTWGGFLGAIALLMRSRWAVWLWLVSLLGAVGSFFVARTTDSVPESMDPGILPYIIVAIAAALLIYAIRMKRSGVLR